jgi:hypothetical protein
MRCAQIHGLKWLLSLFLGLVAVLKLAFLFLASYSFFELLSFQNEAFDFQA